MGKALDLTNQKFGRWKVINKTDERINGSIAWKCECECGTIRNISAALLKSGQSRSCGCLQKEQAAKSCFNQFKKYNKYNLDGVYGIGYTSSNKEFYFDLEDYDKIKDICWSVIDNGYLTGWRKGVCYTFHRLILKTDKGYDIDHINHNKLDNRKSNLRICSRSENLRNKSPETNSLSGRRGVTFIKGYNKWSAYIQVDRQHINLGYYDSPEEAIKQRELAEIKYFGDYMYKEKADC